MTFNSFIKLSFLKIKFKWALDDGKGNLKTGEMGNEQIKYSVSMRISLNSMWTSRPTPTRFSRSLALAQLSFFFCFQSFTTCHSLNTFLFLSGHSDLPSTVVAVTMTLSHSNIHYLTCPHSLPFYFSSFSTVDVRQRFIRFISFQVSLLWVSVTVLFLVTGLLCQRLFRWAYP